MGKAGGRVRGHPQTATAGALALALTACASGPAPQVYDLSPAQPPRARPLHAQISIAQPVATLDLDSESVLVRTTPMTLATLPQARWPQSLTSLFRARLVASLQNAGLTRYLAAGGATADYQLNLDIRSFELDAQRSEAHIDIAATIVSTASGRIAAVDIFDTTVPVAATDAANVVPALDKAAAIVMTKIVAFVAKSI